MKSEQSYWSIENGWYPSAMGQLGEQAQLVLVFGIREDLCNPHLLAEINSNYKNAIVVGCSTSGNIMDTNIFSDGVVVTAIYFEKTALILNEINLDLTESNYEAGRLLASQFPSDNLKHMLVLSPGVNVNGSELVRGINEYLPENVVVTGGLAGDEEAFANTVVLSGHRTEGNLLTGIGFYGQSLTIGYGSVGGWDSFGPEKVITKSCGNVVYEIDNLAALPVYKRLLGSYAKALPATGLLFPLSVHTQECETPLVRTLLGIDEDHESLIFAGDVPEGCRAHLMMTNFDRLIEGACQAAAISLSPLPNRAPDLAILISCVGRRLVLNHRSCEEVEAVRDRFGSTTTLAGFYSYGEICPSPQQNRSMLHNQTMTITAIWED